MSAACLQVAWQPTCLEKLPHSGVLQLVLARLTDPMPVAFHVAFCYVHDLNHLVDKK